MKGLTPKVKSYFKQSSPAILTFLGTLGVVGTAVMAVKATPKAINIIDANGGIDNDGYPYSPTKFEATIWLARRMPAVEEQIKVINRRIDDLKNIAKIKSQFALRGLAFFVFINNMIKFILSADLILCDRPPSAPCSPIQFLRYRKENRTFPNRLLQFA